MDMDYGSKMIIFESILTILNVQQINTCPNLYNMHSVSR